MKQTCIVRSCPNFVRRRTDVDFFYIPSDRYNARAWLTATNRLDLIHHLRSKLDYFVCSTHFSKKQFNNHGNFNKPRLMPNAVPDQLLLGPNDATTSSAAQKTLAKAPKFKKYKAAATSDHSEKSEKELASSQDPLVGTHPLLLKDLQGDGNVQKKVVKLCLPPGVSAKEFASSDALKNITSKLSGLINNTDNANTFILKLKTPAAAFNDAHSNHLSNISHNKRATEASLSSSIKVIRVDDLGEAGASATTEKPSGRSSGTKRNLEWASNSGEEVHVQAPATTSSTRIRVKRMKLEDQEDSEEDEERDLDDPDYPEEEEEEEETAAAIGSQITKAGVHQTRKRVNQYKPTVEVGSNYFNYQRQLVMKQSQREQLIRKIRRQKQVLLKRGNELCRYRLQLKKLREKHSQRSSMTLTDCMRILKGNMHEHALELLYTQLVGKDKPTHPLEVDSGIDGHQEEASGRGIEVKYSKGAGRLGEGPSHEGWKSHPILGANEVVVYTPKVLESALLFSVAGKKAYKAMSQSLKLPSYNDVVKWKKIIRSDPATYRKHFPHLRAKFFKKRKPEEKGGCGGGKKAKKEEQNHDGWLSDREGGRRIDGGGMKGVTKHDESHSVTQEEADYLYHCLLSNQEKFEKLFEEEEIPSSVSALNELEDFPDLITENDADIDFNIDAAEFIKRLKEKEKLQLYGEEEWEKELEQLNEVEDADNNDGELSSAAGLDSHAHDGDCKQTKPLHVIPTVSEVIERVLSKRVPDGASSSSREGPPATITVSLSDPHCTSTETVLTSSSRVLTVLNEDGHGEDNIVEDRDTSLPNIEASNTGTLFISDEDAIIAQTDMGEKIAYVSTSGRVSAAARRVEEDDATGGMDHSTEEIEIEEGETCTYDVVSSEEVVVVPSSGGHHATRVTYFKSVDEVDDEQQQLEQEAEECIVQASPLVEHQDDEQDPGPSMPEIF